MKLKILGSGSSGNCYVFDNGNEALVVECGIDFKKVKESVDFDISRITAALVSHEHKDHSRMVDKFLDAQIPVYMSAGTAKSLNIPNNHFLHMIVNGSVYNVGHFKILAFPTQHDAQEPFGFLIYHEEMGMVLFATDTYYLEYKFKGLNNILIECNYKLAILESNIAAGTIPEKLRDRTIKSHCSLKTCKEILLANDLSMVNNIVLIHLSDGNSNAEEFQMDIQEATGKNVYIANKGMTLEFNRTPF